MKNLGLPLGVKYKSSDMGFSFCGKNISRMEEALVIEGRKKHFEKRALCQAFQHIPTYLLYLFPLLVSIANRI
jgi:hypothetical protein